MEACGAVIAVTGIYEFFTGILDYLTLMSCFILSCSSFSRRSQLFLASTSPFPSTCDSVKDAATHPHTHHLYNIFRSQAHILSTLALRLRYTSTCILASFIWLLTLDSFFHHFFIHHTCTQWSIDSPKFVLTTLSPWRAGEPVADCECHATRTAAV